MKAPTPAQPYSIEREYARALRTYQKAYVSLVNRHLPELIRELRVEVSRETPEALALGGRMDADAARSVSKLFDMILMRLEKTFPDTILKRWATGMIARTSKLSAKNQARHVKKATEIAAEGPVEIGGILTAEKKLSPYFQNIVEQNVALIRSIPQEKIPAFKNALVNAITQDLPVKEIANIVRKHYAATDKKAVLIARDQVGKLNGALDEFHQKQIGVKRYRWKTMGDGAVRHDHKLLNNTIQRWDRPPIVDKKSGRRAHPKGDIQCRCYAEAVLEDILD